MVQAAAARATTDVIRPSMALALVVVRSWFVYPIFWAVRAIQLSMNRLYNLMALGTLVKRIACVLNDSARRRDMFSLGLLTRTTRTPDD